jgi:hypothetical protein
MLLYTNIYLNLCFGKNDSITVSSYLGIEVETRLNLFSAGGHLKETETVCYDILPIFLLQWRTGKITSPENWKTLPGLLLTNKSPVICRQQYWVPGKNTPQTTHHSTTMVFRVVFVLKTTLTIWYVQRKNRNTSRHMCFPKNNIDNLTCTKKESKYVEAYSTQSHGVGVMLHVNMPLPFQIARQNDPVWKVRMLC